MQALFALVAPLLGGPVGAPQPFRTVSRRVPVFGQGPALFDTVIQPALFLWEDWPEEHSGGERGLPIGVWEVWFVIIFRNDDRLTPGATIMNPLIDALIGPDGVLAPDNLAQNKLQLLQPQPGGTSQPLVASVYVDGPVLKNTGDMDAQGQGRASIAVKILVP